jgi:uncharacterized protein (UPF0264 family)
MRVRGEVDADAAAVDAPAIVSGDATRTRVLASVRSVEEARIALDAGVDIIDLKDPARGALGAVEPEVIRAVVARVGGRRVVSATAGDLPMVPALVSQAVERIATLGVDIVKVGLFGGGDSRGVLAALAQLAARGRRIVVVSFAESFDSGAILETEMFNSGTAFAGVMLDTADKRRGSLREHVDDALLAAFVRRTHAAGLMCGLAGSLRVEDVPALVALAPDYLGFRGALCSAGRTSALDAERMRDVCRAVQAASATSAATATAGAQRALHSRTRGVPSTRLAKST